MISRIEKILKIFADKNRIRIINLLGQRKMCVCELAHILGVTQPSVSRHLKKMKEAGLIEDEQDGFWTNYFLCQDSPWTADLLDYIRRWLKEDAVLSRDQRQAVGIRRDKVCRRSG